MTLLAIALLIPVCFIQRLSLTWRVPFSFDSWGHLYFLSAVKRQKTGPFSPITVDVVSGGPFHYPLLTHWLLSFLPQAVIQRWVKAINPCAEALGLGLFMALALRAGLDDLAVASAGLLYIFTPMMFSKVAIGSTSHFTTRLYSELSAGLLALLAFLPLPMNGGILCVLMSVLVAYIVLSSKFGLQMILLVFVPTALVTLKLPLLGALAIGFSLAVLISRGGVLKTWGEQGRHLLWYLRETRKGRMPIADRNTAVPFRKALAAPGLKQALVQLAFALVGRNSFTGLLLKFPVAIGVALLLPGSLSGVTAAAHGFPQLLIVALLVFVVVNCTVFIILGEAERYLNHFAFLIVLVFAEWAAGSGGALWWGLAVCWGVGYWLAELVMLGIFRLNRPDEDEDGAYRTLVEAAPQGSVVLSYPYHVLPPWRLLTTSRLKPVFPIVGTGPGTARLKAMESYPYIDLSHLQELRRDFDLAFVVAQDRLLTQAAIGQLKSDGWHALPAEKSKGITIFTHPEQPGRPGVVAQPVAMAPDHR